MNAVELKFADGKGAGFWYCSTCRQVQSDTREDTGQWGMRSQFRIWKEHGDSRWNKERATACCTGIHFNLCTGCRLRHEKCNCGRAKKNLCTGCQEKLFLREGEFLQFGATKREFCRECALKLQDKLVDAG